MILLACLGAFALAFLVLWWGFRDATWRLDEHEDYDVTNYKRTGFRGED